MEIAPRIIYKHYAFSDNPQVQQQMQMQMQMQMQHQLQHQLQVQPHQQIGYVVPVNMNMNLGCVPVPMSNVPIIPYDTTAASSPSSSTSTSAAAAGPAAAPPPSACAPGVYPAYYQPSIPSTSSPPYAYAANIPQTQFYDTTPTTTTTAATQPQAFKLPPISSIMQGGASSAKSSVSSTSSAGTIHSSPLAAPGNMNQAMSMGGMAPMTPPASAAHSPRSASAEQATPVVAATPVAATTSTAPSKKSKRKKFICDGIGKHLSPEVRQKKQCPVCGKKCSRPSTLKTHYLIHTGDNPYVCTRPGCDKSFNVKSNLQRHIRSHDRKLAKTLAQMQQYGPLY